MKTIRMVGTISRFIRWKPNICFRWNRFAPDRDIDQSLIALKKGTQLIKYSRKGKPKFCTFRLSPDETTLIWYSHGAERNLTLSSVSRIIPGQRTPVFKRYLRPEKDYLSFSLIYNNGERSLDLICKDKVESEVWLAGLKGLISTSQPRSRQTRSEDYDLHSIENSQDNRPYGTTLEFTSSLNRGRISTDSTSHDSSFNSSSSHVGPECAIMQPRTSSADGFRISVSSTPSCSSQSSGLDDIESLGDLYLWGEIWSDGVATDGTGYPIPIKIDVLTPKPLETNIVLDVHQIACGVRHVALVTRQGEVFTWGEESGGRLGHGIEKDFPRPRLVEFLAVTNVDFVACGEFHTCALSASGDLYTWGDGTHNVGLLGHGNHVSHWIPKRVSGPLEGLQVLSVACGTWHSALTTSAGQLFTFGDGKFGALGHGNRISISYPKEVQSLRGLKAIVVSCGIWHTAAIIGVTNQTNANILSKKLFTWAMLACGNNMTVALTTSGHVFTMGNNAYGQLGNPQSDGKLPSLVQDRLVGEFAEQISAGADHIAVLTSRGEVFTWGRGANGRLGHGDSEDRNVPTLVEALKDKHVRNIACGSSYTASICIHKWVSGADQSVCTACKQAFGFTRKRHNCYNCGLVHCHACSSKKAMRAALAPTPGKPHRVCDSCYLKLRKAVEAGTAGSTNRRASIHRTSMDMTMRLDRGEARTSRVLLFPTVEPVKYLEIKSGSAGAKSDNYSIVRASQVPSLLQLKDIAFPSSLSALQSALKPVITSSPHPQQSYPQPQSNSRPVSPYSRRPSPPHAAPVFSRGVIDTLKKTNDILTQEVSKLRGQKSEVQDAEIQKLKKTGEEAAALAAERSSKCIRAIGAVKTISDQLKEITDKLPPETSESESLKSSHAQVESFLESFRAQVSEDNAAFPSGATNEQQNHFHSVVVQDMSQNTDGAPRENNGTFVSHAKASNPSSTENGSATSQSEKVEGQKEVIEQFEPGVYVTVVPLPNGTKIFKRVRFSKRRFAEQQAEEWWKENKDRVLKKYSPPKPNTRTPSEAIVAAQPPADDANQATSKENNDPAQLS
ncbi:UNVERIFIED_CONTAM: PH, RCC1 and FYVE domains-containing protein 1 [Sesamum angustifolium]|uniref:PH, RCC1 and FYVE domains-containing protein 1 n=1 Tax=Sesamum angustifolium TaxID=2727405 RepID=A0AAW2P0K9_9LAMI